MSSSARSGLIPSWEDDVCAKRGELQKVEDELRLVVNFRKQMEKQVDENQNKDGLLKAWRQWWDPNFEHDDVTGLYEPIEQRIKGLKQITHDLMDKSAALKRLINLMEMSQADLVYLRGQNRSKESELNRWVQWEESSRGRGDRDCDSSRFDRDRDYDSDRERDRERDYESGRENEGNSAEADSG